MDRLNLDAQRVSELRAQLQSNYPDHATPIVGTSLKIDDDVLWLDYFPMRVLWGHDHPAFFNGYCPEIFGDCACNVEGIYITDRAPADANETPMPIYPAQQLQQQQQQQQPKSTTDDRKKAIQNVLKQLAPADAKRARDKIRELAPDLFGGDKDDADDKDEPVQKSKR